MKSSIFKKNMGVLKVRYPELFKKINATTIPKELKLLRTNSRYPTLALDLYGRYAFFHSKNNPVKEAEEQIKGFNITASINILILGVGLGYHLIELQKKLTKDNYVVIVEQYLPIFKLAMQCIDLTGLLTNNKVFFFVDCRPEEIFEAMKTHVFHLANNDLVVLRHDTSCLLFRDYYDVVEKRIKELIVWARKNFEAGLKFRRLYQQNIIRNLYFYFKCPGISHLRDLDFPCIIAAAGPSLEQAIDVLRKIGNRAIIISVDTAMYPLIKRGIKPHFVVSIDPHRINYMHFSSLSDEAMKETGLIIDPQVYYEIPRKYKGPIFVPTLKDSKIIEYFSDIVGDKGTIQKGMSVAHSAFSLALRMGCSPIIFVGLDLSFPETGTHIKDAANYQERLESNRNLLKVKGVGEKEVITDDVFYAYIKHFEIEVSKTDVLCLNASSGAYIEGMKHIAPKEICEYVSHEFLLVQDLFDAPVPCVNQQDIEERKAFWISKSCEIKEKALYMLNQLKDESQIGKAKELYSQLRGYGLIIDILEENMETAAFLLSNRKLWQGRKEKEKFELYYQELVKSCEFIIKEVNDAGLC